MSKTVTLGNAIFADLANNPYMNELYKNILYNYSLVLLKNSTASPKEVNIEDALRFADLLSKSHNNKEADTHKILAQEIVALLDKLYPDNAIVRYFMGSVLSNTGNYRGLDLCVPKYTSTSVLDRFYTEFSKELVAIPAEPDKQFFRSQKTVYEHFTDDYFSYSGPTSMGKTFIMRMFVKEQIIKGASLNFCLLVPTKALINEVTSNMINDLKELLAEHNYRVVTSAGDLGLKKSHNFILILTPERLLYLLLSNKDFRIDYLFVDEAHKISGKDSRSTFYYKVVDMLSNRTSRTRIIFSSPNIPNPEVYLQLIPHAENTSERKFTSSFAPVSQIKYLVDTVEKKIQIYNNLTGNLEDISKATVQDSLVKLILSLGKDSQNIVYCSSTDKPVSYALEYAKYFSVKNDNLLESLSKEIKAEIHGDYFLAELIRKGIAYHIGYLPSSIKLRIEELYKKRAIHTVFCTSTLVEGVNFPADNLFVTSYKNGRPEMTPVDFRNLIGRVGRIEYGLYGNVFLVRLEDKIKIEKFKKLLNQEVPEQELSIVSVLTKSRKQIIIDSLIKGNMEFPKHPNNQSEDSYVLMRKFAIIFLRDITLSNNSIVRRAFDGFLTSDIEVQIRSKFNQNNTKPDDDINISVDQTNNLTKAIAKGLEYPTLKDDGTADYTTLMRFLEHLCVIFKWDKYESKTLGRRSKDNGQYGMLRWYAVILAQWIAGTGLSFIIERALIFKSQNPKSGVKIDRQMVDYDPSSPRHRNEVISETLKVIEHIVLFSISNYFLRFSEEYKRFHGVKDFPNDWYEYVEYGTTNPLTITLQRNGFSRETATYIKTHKAEYVAIMSGDIKLRNSILDCYSSNVRREVNEIKYNVPELFTD